MDRTGYDFGFEDQDLLRFGGWAEGLGFRDQDVWLRVEGHESRM